MLQPLSTSLMQALPRCGTRLQSLVMMSHWWHFPASIVIPLMPLEPLDSLFTISRQQCMSYHFSKSLDSSLQRSLATYHFPSKSSSTFYARFLLCILNGLVARHSTTSPIASLNSTISFSAHLVSLMDLYFQLRSLQTQ